MKISGIYQIQSKKNPRRIYIGSSLDIHRRWNEHLRDLKNNRHRSAKLQRHYNKYGRHDLQFSILISCSKDDIIQNEQFFIDAYNPYFNSIQKAMHGIKPKGQVPWNKGKKTGQIPWNKGVRGRITFKMPEEAKRRISRAMIGNQKTKGLHPSDETRKKLSIAAKNRKPISEETRRKIAETLKGNIPWNKGKLGLQVAWNKGLKKSDYKKRSVS